MGDASVRVGRFGIRQHYLRWTRQGEERVDPFGFALFEDGQQDPTCIVLTLPGAMELAARLSADPRTPPRA